MSDPPSQKDSESDLLVPFESQHIPTGYKEYYKIKRNNLFASILGFPEMWKYYVLLDNIWTREFGDLKPPGNVHHFFPLVLFYNAHSKIRVSIELALSGCLGEARSILRDGVESIAHAHRMITDPKLQEVWLTKDEDGKAFREAFDRHKREGLFKGLDELYRTWGELSETGSHTTLKSLCQRFTAVETEDGGQLWNFRYCGIDSRSWGMSLFSMLLTCFTMENTFFGDYESRLRLDHVLVRMREEFQQYKEQLRRQLIVRYNVTPPSSGPVVRP